MTTTLTEFLPARNAEDERAARKLAETDHRPVLSLATTINHPGRLLAECEAKRRIIALHKPEPGQHPDFCGHDLRELPCPTLRALALPYADHPDYLPEWKP